MKKIKHYLFLAVFCIVLTLSQSCKKEILVDSHPQHLSLTNHNLAVTPNQFNWETVDWMPTPPGQTQIPPPWVGQGSIASVYGTDVINDHKAADGWVLVYNTFDPNATSPLQNPYFILYNKYRGLMRIYLYTTTQFVVPSSYVVDGLTVVSSTSSSMLNFLGADIVDPTKNQNSFTQIEPAPIDGSAPLASNKWYMLQYEMAYDPQIASLNYQNIQLSWFTNFNTVSSISLGGTATGTIKTATGAPTSTMNTALTNAGKTAATGAIAIIGSNVVQGYAVNNGGDDTKPNNSMGLSNSAFTSILKGVTGAISAATGGIPGAVVGILSAVIGGTSSSPTMNLNLNASITLKGTMTTQGAFPASPTSIYVPGSTITSSAQNYVPLYNQTLGVFNVTTKPMMQATENDIAIPITDPYDGSNQTDYRTDMQYWLGSNAVTVTWNPAIINSSSTGATIQNFKQDIVLLLPSNNQQSWVYNTNGVDEGTMGGYEIMSFHNPTASAPAQYSYYTQVDPNEGFYAYTPPQPVVRISFDIVPNNGAPKSTIVKTFYANQTLN